VIERCFQRNEEVQMPQDGKIRTHEAPIVESATEARSGIITGRMLSVLIVSTIGAFVVLALLYLYYFGLPFSGTKGP
jgi:hypothetical protein